MKGLCLIVSGGEFSPLPEGFPPPARVIACDKGWQHARRLGLAPGLVLGDFDSAPAPEGTEAEIIRVPTRKDDTDTMLAARRALEEGWWEIALCCAFGGRLDHTLANLQTAAFLVRRGARVRLLGRDCDGLCFSGGTERFPRRRGWSLSLFALSDRCQGVSVRGAKYPCENQTLKSAFPLGVSNLWTSEAAEISVGRGILLVLQSRLKEGEHI